MDRLRTALCITAISVPVAWLAHIAAPYAANLCATETIRTAHFRITSLRSDAVLSNRVALLLESEYSRVARALRYELSDRVAVRVTSSRFMYNLSCGLPFPTPPGDGFDGAAGKDGAIVLLPSGWRRAAETEIPDRGRQVAIHEVLHVIVFKMNPAIVHKRWLNEGVVWYLALGMDTPEMRRLDNEWTQADIEGGRVPKMADIAGNDQRAWRSHKGDYYSRQFVQFVAERYGVDKIPAMVRNASDLRTVLGNDEAELFPAYLQYLRARNAPVGDIRADK